MPHSLASQRQTVTSRTTRVIIVQEISDTSSTAAASNELSLESSSPSSTAASAGRHQAIGGEVERSCMRHTYDLDITSGQCSPVDDNVDSPSSCMGQVDRILSTLALHDVQSYDDLQRGRPASATDAASQLSVSPGTSDVNSEEQQTTMTRTTTTLTSCIEYVAMTSRNTDTKSSPTVLHVVTSGGDCMYHHNESLAKISDDETLNKERAEHNQTTATLCTFNHTSGGSKLTSGKSPFVDGVATVSVDNCQMQTMSGTVEQKQVDSHNMVTTITLDGGEGGNQPAGPWVSDHTVSNTSKMISSLARAAQRKNIVKKIRSLARPIAVGPIPSEGTNNTFGNSSATITGGTRTPKILHHGVDDLACIQDSLTYRMLRPIIAAMTVVGLYYTRQGAALGRGGSPRLCLVDSLTRRINSRQQIYCVFVILVLLANFIWSLTAFSVS